MPMSSRSALRLLCVAPLTLTLAGCLGSGNAPPLKLSLPDAPTTFGAPVAAPMVHQGDDLRVLSAKERAALVAANSRLKDDQLFYDDVKKRFGP